MMPNRPPAEPLARRPHLLEDARALTKYASLAGAALAVLCHLLPPHYRPICDTLAALCRGESP